VTLYFFHGNQNVPWYWAEVHQKAFDDVKATIAKEVVLAYPDSPLLIAQASFTLDLSVRLAMFLIGKMISSMVIDLALKSMTIPKFSIELHTMMRSNTGVLIFWLYSNTSGSARNSLLLLYSKNLIKSLPLPFVWKTSFDICHEHGTCLVK
jgi:hypothetical protein